MKRLSLKALKTVAFVIALICFDSPSMAQRGEELDVCELIGRMDTVQGSTVMVRDRVLRSPDSLILLRGDCDEAIRVDGRIWPTIIQLVPTSRPARASVGELVARLQRASEKHTRFRVEATFIGSVEAVGATVLGFGPKGNYPARLNVSDVRTVTVAIEASPLDLKPVTVCEVLQQPDSHQGERIALRGISQSIRGSHALCGPCETSVEIEGMVFPSCVAIDYSIWRTRVEVPGLEENTNPERVTSSRRDVGLESTYVGVFHSLNPYASSIQGFGLSGMEFAAKLYYETYRDTVTLPAQSNVEWTTKPYPRLTRQPERSDKNCQRLESLTELVSAGCTEEVREMIRRGADLNSTDVDGKTPLWHAVQWEQANLVEILLEAGAEVDSTVSGWTPLCRSVIGSEARIIRLLLDFGAQVNDGGNVKCNALAEAARAGSPETVKLLIDAGANVEARNHWNWTPLQTAVFKNRPENVRILLASGADPDVLERGKSPLLRHYRTPALARVLIEGGADVDVSDEKGVTVLMKASLDALPNLVDQLLAAGADVNRKDNQGSTALFYAVRGVCVSCVKSLRLAGAEVRTVNTAGRTVFDLISDDVAPAIRRALDESRQ